MATNVKIAFEKEIFDTILQLGGKDINIKIVSYNESDFGNYLVHASSSLGRIKITRDRGLTFVDILVSPQEYIHAEDISESVMAIQKRGQWTLQEQLNALFTDISRSHDLGL